MAQGTPQPKKEICALGSEIIATLTDGRWMVRRQTMDNFDFKSSADIVKQS